MRVITDPTKIKALAHRWRKSEKTLGFVPTMGALHEGHLSLVRRSVRENAFTVVSIYVNPLQFGPKEDFKQYPRTIEDDLAILGQEKVSVVFTPSDREMYPEGFSARLEVTGPLVRGLCARYRPGHFNGVATIVVKLLGLVQPTTLYLGQKDAQQSVILGQVIRDLNLCVRVAVCPIFRERDGLAMSSRNRRLTPQGRQIAPLLYRSLTAGKNVVKSGITDAKKVLAEIKKIIRGESKIKLQYLEAVDPRTLLPVKKIKSGSLIALAAYLDNVRLIDNIVV
jgi:pantoate--beta-alanine ligase